MRAAKTFKSSHRPNGISTCFALCLQGGGVYVQDGTVTFSSCTIIGNTAVNGVRAHAQESPLPDGIFTCFAPLCLQGGVYVQGGTVTFSPCTITGNTASNVRVHAQISHRPDGKMADMPKSTLIFQFGSLFGSIRDMYVPATPANFPSPRWENC